MASGTGGVWSRSWRYLAGAILLMIIATGLGTVVPRPVFTSTILPAEAGAVASVQSRTILVLSSAIHTDIALPASPDVVERFAFMAADGVDPAQPGVGSIIAGWGGRSFYIETPTWSDLKPGPVFSALTVDRSVMHMGLAGAIDPQHASVTAIALDEASFERLVNAILDSFKPGADGRPEVVAGAQYGQYDLFYEAEGRFNALVGCNVWTARMLRQAGLRTGWWTPLPALLDLSLRLHNPQSRFGYRPAAR